MKLVKTPSGNNIKIKGTNKYLAIKDKPKPSSPKDYPRKKTYLAAKPNKKA